MFMLKSKFSFLSSVKLLMFTLMVLSGAAALKGLLLEEALLVELVLLQFYSMKFSFFLLLDKISLLFSSAVCLITFSVLTFSGSYMGGEKSFSGFHLILMSFVASMLLLIFSPNLISAMVGWDGLGLSSYLLVIYYSNAKSYNSGMITVLSNRVGDILILSSIALLISEGGWNMSLYGWTNFPIVAWLVMLASTTKSAQIPFSAWLPAAMAAPTPVSSLVHSSTLVTAGVYLLIRHSDFFWVSGAVWYLLSVGSLTMLMASTAALFETDLKKMVALSTLSQLGVMMIAVGGGCVNLAFFHLLSHAFFKALLFLATGNIIHSSNNYQDLRLVGASAFSLPVSSGFVLLANASLCGIPFTSAFYSKEAILESLLCINSNSYGYFLMGSGVLLTVLYSARFMVLVFSAYSKSSVATFKSDEDPQSVSAMLTLAFPALSGGAALGGLLASHTSLAVSPSWAKFIILLFLISPLLLMKFYLSGSRSSPSSPLAWSLGNMWMLPLFSPSLLSPLFLKTGEGFCTLLDRGALVSLNKLALGAFSGKMAWLSVGREFTMFALLMGIWAVVAFLIVYMCSQG